MEGARADTTDFGYKMGKKKRGAEEAAPNLRMLSPEQIVREIKRLEAEMFKHARNLEFEEAARMRDAIEKMKQQELGLPMPVEGAERAPECLRQYACGRVGNAIWQRRSRTPLSCSKSSVCHPVLPKPRTRLRRLSACV